jgi:hypothetical protein
MVVMRRRMAETKSKNVPMWWKKPVFAMAISVMMVVEYQM